MCGETLIWLSVRQGANILNLELFTTTGVWFDV
jgi:hypothetical protein